MFNVGDRLKVNVVAFEPQIAEWKGSQVYDNLLKSATDKRFEVVGMDNVNYSIKRLEDNQIMQENKTFCHTNFEKAND
jgi:hypothetical protein